MGVMSERWLAALQALLPPGDALTREPGANLTRLLGAVAELFGLTHEQLEDLRAQSSDPLQASEMLEDWERLLGLPDDCMVGVPLSLLERRSIALQRLTEVGGQSRAYFIDLAARFGEPGCTITEFRPMNCNDDCNDALYSEADRFFWRVNVPHPAANARPMNCNDDCNDALQYYTPSLIECPITERKPAHTNVLFAYAP
ncbi:YmfQ family protein [Variovorax sp. VNK109]|uniref:YmfQ family protein n=1 Tax=Variovorax sp. VNK109 TaxID=3400919 RepID=UPI003C03E1C2